MSRRVPRTLRTLKLDYREIAALLPGPPFPSLSSAPEPARLPPPPPPPPSQTIFSPASLCLSVLLRSPQTSSSSTFATSFPESFLSFASPASPASPLTAEPTWWALLPALPAPPSNPAFPSSSFSLVTESLSPFFFSYPLPFAPVEQFSSATSSTFVSPFFLFPPLSFEVILLVVGLLFRSNFSFHWKISRVPSIFR